MTVVNNDKYCHYYIYIYRNCILFNRLIYTFKIDTAAQFEPRYR